MFTIPPGNSPFARLRRPRPLDLWRDAAARVWSQWDLVLVAPAAGRAAAFAAYLAALDAEAAAADELVASFADLPLPLAA